MTSLAMSPIRLAGAGGSRPRKITVNERVEQILQGSLLQNEGDGDVDNTSSQHDTIVRESAATRNQQMSNLYGSSTEDRFVRTRVKAQDARSPMQSPSSSQQQQRTRRVPPIDLPSSSQHHLHHQLGQSVSTANNVITSPIKPVRCLALQMLEQQRVEDERNRARLTDDDTDDLLSPPRIPGKPWYSGTSSNVQLPTCSVDANVRRYGAFGTAKMLATATSAGTAPVFRLHASQSLDVLAPANAPSPWSPPLHGSPTLWPEDANYATGCALEAPAMLRCASPSHRFPTHSVGDIAVDRHLQRTKAVHASDARVLEAAFESEKRERHQEAVHNRERLEQWHAHVGGSATHHTSKRASDHTSVRVRTRRAKELTIVHTPAYSSAPQYDAEVAALTLQRFALRWRNWAIVVDAMRRTPCRRPVLQDIDKLYMLAYELAYSNTRPVELTRQQFCELLQREYPTVELRHANRLFSSYDVSIRDALDIRVLLGTVRALRVQQGTPLEIVALSLQDFDTTKRGVVSSVTTLTTVLSLCCSSDEDECAMTACAAALWTYMTSDCAQFYRNARVRQTMRSNRDDSNSSSMSSTLSTTAREAYESSPAFSDGTFSIQYVRHALPIEKHALELYSDLLLKRREECFRAQIPPSR